MTRRDLLEAKLVWQHRVAHPESRIVGILRIGHNTGSRKNYTCALCRVAGPTFAAQWPETKRSRTWRKAHVEEHLAEADSVHTFEVASGKLACLWEPDAAQYDLDQGA